MKNVRTRYAPSPTGFFHIGGARSALFNYLIAKKNKGQFLLRIEDTDIERNVKGGNESQLDNLKWLGIFPDESFENPNKKYAPYIQSERLDIYKTYADKLLENKKAYKCFCTSEELELQRNEQLKNGHQSFRYGKICLKLTDEQIETNLKNNKPYSIRIISDIQDNWIWKDSVRGEINFPKESLDDFVIVKNNGYPTYNFAVVIDDHLMDITDVLRGEEHIANTPKQLVVYKALDINPPNFGHLSLVTNHEGKKLSKRDQSIVQFIEQYKNMGYPPQAIVNYLVFLGWTPGTHQEIFSMSELINIFDEKRISKAPAKFDEVKMQWIANKYFQAMSDTEYLEYVKPFIAKLNHSKSEEESKYIALLFKKQISYAEQIINLSKFLFEEETISESSIKKIKEMNGHSFLPKFVNALKNIEWKEENIKSFISSFGKDNSISGVNYFMPIRLLISNHEHGPELFKLIYLLGINKIENKLKEIK